MKQAANKLLYISNNKNNNATPEVSVTMAAYNVKDYIKFALESVLNQSFTNFEFIIVDDASTDGTQEILESFAQCDSRIRLFINKKNEGLASARNFGISHARGKWVAFLDADDCFNPEMLRLAVEAGNNAKAEMVLWDYVVFTKESEISTKALKLSDLRKIDPCDRIALLDRPAFAWTRLVTKEALIKLNIKFPVGLTYQDILVHWMLITQLEKIVLLPKRLAYYRQQPYATTSGKGLKRTDIFIVLDQVETYLKSKDLFTTYADSLTSLQLNAWYGIYDVIAEEHKNFVRSLIISRLKLEHKKYIQSNKKMRWQARSFYMAIDGDRLAKIRLATRNIFRNIYRFMKNRK